MILLYILLGILALLALILFSSASAEAKIADDFTATVKFWFLKLTFPAKKPKRIKDKPKTDADSKEEKAEEKKPGFIKIMIDEKGVTSAIGELFAVLKSILTEFGRLTKHIRIKRFKFFVNVATDDSALTAVEYGAVCAVVFPAVRFIEDNTKLNRKKTNVFVNSDFVSGKSKIELDAKVKIRVIFLFMFAIKALIQLVKLKLNNQPSKQKEEVKQ